MVYVALVIVIEHGSFPISFLLSLMFPLTMGSVRKKTHVLSCCIVPSSAEEIRLLRAESRITIIPSLQVTSKAFLDSAFFAFFISSLLPTEREGNVLRGVCQSFCLQGRGRADSPSLEADSPVKADPSWKYDPLVLTSSGTPL